MLDDRDRSDLEYDRKRRLETDRLREYDRDERLEPEALSLYEHEDHDEL